MSRTSYYVEALQLGTVWPPHLACDWRYLKLTLRACSATAIIPFRWGDLYWTGDKGEAIKEVETYSTIERSSS